MTIAQWKKEFEKQVRNKMSSMNINQRELAQLSNISEVAMSRYLSGQRIPNINVIVDIAKALKCTVSELIQFGEIVELR